MIRPIYEYSLGTLALDQKRGIRVGIIARDTSDDTWPVAQERFPPDRRRDIAHRVAMKTSDSRWHQDFSRLPHVRFTDLDGPTEAMIALHEVTAHDNAPNVCM